MSSLILVELFITVLGMGLQFANIIYSIKHALKFSKVYNSIICASMIIIFMSAVPLLISSAIGNSPFKDQEDKKFRNSFENKLGYVHSNLFFIGSLIYILCLQLRFKVIRTVWNYPQYLDNALIGITALTWGYFCVYSSSLKPIINPGSKPDILSGAAWSLYCLIIENFLSICFMLKFFKLSVDTDRMRQLKTHVLKSCFVLAGASWICLSIAFTAGYVYAHDDVMRKFVYRISFSFSYVVYSGALVLVYSAKQFVELAITEFKRQAERMRMNEKTIRYPSSTNITDILGIYSP